MAPEPCDFPRRILLAVTGLSPQVITETVYALSQTAQPAFVPSEVRLITTAEGAERARLSLLPEGRGWLRRLCVDYGLPDIAFDPAHIEVLDAADGSPLDDIRSPEDNARAADRITDAVRRYTADPQSALHVSIAGGRKTMGFYLGYALSLFGRAQDRLSHVLVRDPFESSWDFFYPTPYSEIIETRDNKLVDSANASVTLASIPFVPLRHGLPRALLDGGQTYTASYQASVSAARLALAPPSVSLGLAARRVEAGGVVIPLSPVELSFYAWFAEQRVAGQPPLPCPKDGVPEVGYAQAFLRIHNRVIGEMGDDERTAAALRSGMDKNYFERRKCGVNKKLAAALGSAASAYQIQRYGRRPHWTFGLQIEPQAIRLR